MSNSRIGTALSYKLKRLSGISIFLLIMVLIMAAMVIGSTRFTVEFNETSRMTVSFYSLSAMIMVLVIGLVEIREDFRLMMQNGIGRRTTMIAEILYLTTMSLILALAGELLVSAGMRLTETDQGVRSMELYRLLYAKDSGYRMSAAMHIESIIMLASLLVVSGTMGILISLVFYRLNRLWTVIVAIGAPLLIFVGIPLLLSNTGLSLTGLVRYLERSAWHLSGFNLIVGIVSVFGSWLLLRRAPVRAVQTT